MSKNQFAKFEAQLLKAQDTLKRRLDAIRSDRRRMGEPLDPDFAEQAVQRENDETLDSLDAKGRHELEAIEFALRRIAAGNFGECLTCGESVPENRLRAYPSAEQCIECASAPPAH